jgi:hypothetical protein
MFFGVTRKVDNGCIASCRDATFRLIAPRDGKVAEVRGQIYLKTSLKWREAGHFRLIFK